VGWREAINAVVAKIAEFYIVLRHPGPPYIAVKKINVKMLEK